jgi:predicted dehydrogenase
MKRLRLAVIGVGHLGKEHARILAGLPDVELVGVADVNAEMARSVAERCGTRACTDYRQLLAGIDAAVIAVPTVFHHAIACDFLRRGISLLVEKPLAVNREQADELVELARRHGALLQVGHIERFNPAFEKLQQYSLQPRLVVCERLGPFTGRSTDVGAVLDLMVHDLDLLLALVPAPVRAVQTTGLSVVSEQEDVASAHLVFANGCVAHVTASRVNPVPSRRMQLWAPEGFASLDFARRHLTLVQPSEELRYRRLNLRGLDPVTLRNDVLRRHLSIQEFDCNQGDQLTRELQDFVRCLRTGSRPRVSGKEGCDAVSLAMRVVAQLDSLRGQSRPGQAAAA